MVMVKLIMTNNLKINNYLDNKLYYITINDYQVKSAVLC